MSTFWIAVVLVVLVLELIRIGLSGYVLIHILDSPGLRRAGEEAGQLERGRQSAGSRVRREALLPSTLDALRGAMDETREGERGAKSASAIEAIDRYVLHLQEERR